MAAVDAGTIPVVGLTNAESTAVVTNLCFASLWLGALGWEVIMTVAFDFRLLKQTNWRSVPSCIHSLAYYVSRYSTIVFIATYVAINAQTVAEGDQGMCQQRITAAAAFFVISECSILLVFITRTMALWNMDKRIILLLTVAWLAAVGINLTLPGYGNGVVMRGFCVWTIKGGWVGASMIAMAVTSLLCLVLTVGKLNRQGWRGLLKSMQPSSNSRSIDAEDVSRVLVQRTTCFFFVMLMSIIVADIVYYTVDFTLWKLIAVPAFLAIAASLAGRIFRRSWKMTHSVEYSRPPSYYPGVWRDDVFQHDTETVSSSTRPSHGRLHIYVASHQHQNSSLSHPLRSKSSHEKFAFVEGQFRSPFQALTSTSVRMLGLPTDKTDERMAMTVTTTQEIDLHGSESSRSHLAVRRASEPAIVAHLSSRMIGEDVMHRADDDGDHVAIDMQGVGGMRADRRPLGAFGISEAPAFLPRARTRTRAVSRNGRARAVHIAATKPFEAANSWDHKKHLPRPSTAPGRNSARPFGDGHQPSPLTQADTLASSSRPNTASSGDSSPSNYATPRQHSDGARWSSLDVSTMPVLSHHAPSRGLMTPTGGALRDDLVMTPTRTRLWLDSSAERARMEANAVPGSSRMSEVESTYASSNAGSSTKRSVGSLSSRRPSTVGQRMVSGATKRLILESATQAGDKLSRQGVGSVQQISVDSRVAEEGMDGAAGSLRSGYLPSPAIVPAVETGGAGREMYDLDAIQRKLVNVPHPPDITRNVPTGQLRPRTAPGHVNEHHQHIERSGLDSEREAADLLQAFRDTINEDDEAEGALDDRPRTSRGGRLGSFGQNSATADCNAMRRTASMNEERLRSRSSGSNTDEVKPFGIGSGSQALSAIEQQYMRLRALAGQLDDEEAADKISPHPTTFHAGSSLASSRTPLERIDSCSTITSTHDSHRNADRSM